MKILLIGSGGREHALAWKLSQSKQCDKLYCAPGNPGIAAVAECISLAVDDIDGLVNFARDKKIDFVVVGPEVPLVLGLVDRLKEQRIPAFGPSQLAARLEGSKGFMKDLCRKYRIPTASYERFTEIDKAHGFINKVGAPIVIKADGLAAGKGVVVATTMEEAKAAASDMLAGNSFGNAGSSIVIEEFLDGEEISYFAIADGESALYLTTAQDHKRVGDGDTGPNTGGMGAYSPSRLMTPALEKIVMDEIILPTVAAMREEGCPFTGVLYAGLMMVNGEPKLLEYNARFGDPECQTLMLRLESDLVEMLYAAATGELHACKPVWSDDPSICVVMAAKGYPGSYAKDTPINKLADASAVPGAMIFHAGTALKDGQLVATGGRVLGVCATGTSLAAAQATAYQAVDKVSWDEGFCRRDIGWRALQQEEAA